jgi:alcohol dehydrogenase class IV
LIILYFKLRAFMVRLLLRLLPRNQPIVFKGPGSSRLLCQQIATLGIERVLIVTDEVLRGVGAIDGVQEYLSEAGVAFEIYDGILPDPSFKQVQAGEAMLRECQSQAVLAIGGGSVLDAAKMMAVLHTNPGPLESFLPVQRCKNPGVPLFAIPSTAGTGSEVTPIAVITDQETHKKTPVIETKMLPGYVAIDAEIMAGMPPGITAATGMDALTHAIESILSRCSTANSELQADAAIKLIFQHLPRAYQNGDALDARDAMGLAAFYAGSAFSNTSVGYVHAIAHQLGRLCGTPHGNANAMVLPEVLEAYGACIHPQLARLAVLTGISNSDAEPSILAGRFIQEIRALRSRLSLPTLPRGLKEEHVKDIVSAAILEAGELYPVPRYMSALELEAIVRNLLPASQPKEMELSRNE